MVRILAMIITGLLLTYGAQAFDIAREQAKASASDILAAKPKVQSIDAPTIKAATSAKAPVKQKDYSEAPLGLAWGSSVKDTKLQGVTLRALDTKNFPGSYEATYLPKPIAELPKVVLSFGAEDKLWRIVTYSDPSFDDDQASKGLYLYKKYYKLLNEKYGNGQESFKPKMISVEKTVTDAQGRPSTQFEDKPSEMGDKTFLADLKSEAASLFATFDGNKIKVSLALRVDETGKSYIVIEYKNSVIMKENNDATLKSL